MSGGLRGETLYLACTRPAMKRGVPMEGWYLNFLGTFFFGLIMGSPLWWVCYLVIHPFMRAYANKNPNFFRECRMWFDTKGMLAGACLYAIPSRNATKAEDLPTYV